MAKIPKRRQTVEKAVDRARRYGLDEAATLVKQCATAKFDETVEIAVRLGVNPKHADQMVRGALVLPHGTGQKVRVLVFAKGDKEREAREAGADFVGADELVAKVLEGNFFDYERVIATPDMMGQVGKLGRVLGPRGLMPNPKIGTVVGPEAIAQTVKELKGGKIDFRVEKAGIVHAMVGKASMEPAQLKENIEALINTLMKLKPASAKGTYLRGAAVSSTMGPGIRLDPSDLTRSSEA